MEHIKRNKRMTVKIAQVGILSAVATVLYLLKFPLPFIFPSFLDIQFSKHLYRCRGDGRTLPCHSSLRWGDV